LAWARQGQGQGRPSTAKAVDDKTLLIFQWNPYAAQRTQPGDGSERASSGAA
jgi:hypothetical protein